MIRKPKLTIEQLEDRSVPAVFGIPWHDPSHLSISFAPDGADIASHNSELFSSLSAQQPVAEWQRTILQAFQTWAVHANLNFGLREDGGQAFGVAGLLQGDPRFGDIRVGAHDMSPEVLAIAIPPDPALAGTWSGDILINSAHYFDGNPYSLLTVMLQESGHALGLSNSSDPDSVMYTVYNTTRTELSLEDIARIQKLYGARAEDSYETSAGNGTLATATDLPLPVDFKGETPMVAFGDITTHADVDFYTISFPEDGNDDKNEGEMTIRLQTSGSSLLAPKITIVNQLGQVLAQKTSTSITGDVLQVKLNGLSTSEKYYVKVEAATQDVFGVGRYGLSVRLDKTSSISDSVIDKLLRGPFDTLGPDAIDAFFRNSGDVLLNADSGDNDYLAGATPLTTSGGFAPGTRYEGVASLAKKEDVDLYRLTAPSGDARVLTATVWTTDSTGFQPTIAVLDGAGNLVAANILVHGNGTSTVQVAQTGAGQTYFLKVSLSQQAGQDKGNYFVSATFGERAVQLRTYAQADLDQNHRETSSRLYVAQTQLFHFVLTAGNEDPGASVRMTIRDDSGNVVYVLSARSGETVSTSSVLLRPGAYTVGFQIENPNGRPLTFRLKGSSKSDPIGPVLSDPTLRPEYTAPPPEPTAPEQTDQTTYYVYPGFDVPFDPAEMPGYINPQDASTFPPGFVLPPELADLPWLIVTGDPFYWISLGL